MVKERSTRTNHVIVLKDKFQMTQWPKLCMEHSARNVSACRFQGSWMVHVWIAPHICGPFAALEGIGAGSASVSDSERVDLCNKKH